MKSKLPMILLIIVILVLAIILGIKVLFPATTPDSINDSTGFADISVEDESQMANTFNSIFAPYIGANIEGTDVKQLIRAVTQNNMSGGETVELTYKGVDYTGEEDVLSNLIQPGSSYTVEVEEYNDDSMIKTIRITEN